MLSGFNNFIGLGGVFGGPTASNLSTIPQTDGPERLSPSVTDAVPVFEPLPPAVSAVATVTDIQITDGPVSRPSFEIFNAPNLPAFELPSAVSRARLGIAQFSRSTGINSGILIAGGGAVAVVFILRILGR